MKHNQQAASDKELSIAISNSDETAFKALYYRYYEPLFAFLWRKTRNHETSKDLIQELFIRVWRNRERLDPSQSLKSYLYRIASNLAIDHLRKKDIEQTHFSDEPASDSSIAPNESFDFEDETRHALKALPPLLLEVFSMSRNDGLTYTEIAETLGVSVKTVESRMSQALKFLRERLKPYLVLFALTILLSYLMSCLCVSIFLTGLTGCTA